MAPWLFHNLPEVCGDHPWMVLPLAGDNAHLSLLIRSISQRPFRHVLPYHSSKQWSFPTTIFLSFDLFRQPSFLSTFWTTWFGMQPKYTWSIHGFGSSRSTSFCRIFTWSACSASFQPISNHPHVSIRIIKAFFVRVKTFPCWSFPHPFSKKQFFIFSFPQKASLWVTTKVPLKTYHKIVNVISTCWSLSWRNPGPNLRTFFFRQS